jgi:hypothetical protein
VIDSGSATVTRDGETLTGFGPGEIPTLHDEIDHALADRVPR